MGKEQFFSRSEIQFTDIIKQNRALFEKKNADYGSSWVILRYSESFTDQIFIKGQRIRTLQETKTNLVGDTITGEFIGIFNYALMGLMVKSHKSELVTGTTVQELLVFYDEQVLEIQELRHKKKS